MFAGIDRLYSLLTMIEKFKKYLLVISCFGYLPLRGRADKRQEPRRIVVMQMAKLGDMVCTTPMFRAIKKRFPDSFLAVVGNAANKDVLEGNTDVDAYIVFDGIHNVRDRLFERDFDTAVITAPDIVSTAVAYLGGISHIIVPRVVGGYSPFESISYRLLRAITGMTVVDHCMGQYAPREYLRLLEPLDIFSDDTSKKLVYSQKAGEEVAAFLESNLIKKENILIGISPSAGNKIKNWGGEKFADLAARLWKEYAANIVVIGSMRDREEVKKMQNSIPPNVPIINAAEKFSIDGLKALISKMDLFVSVDTGPIYIAEAFGVPTVDIVGPMDEREQPPVGPKHIVIVPPEPRTPQLHILNAHGYDVKEARRQINSIGVDVVFDACKKLID